MTVAEWVRQALRLARKKEPSADIERKLQLGRARRGRARGDDLRQVLPGEAEAVERAKEIVLGKRRLSARDALTSPSWSVAGSTRS